jgi:hypothetical protein
MSTTNKQTLIAGARERWQEAISSNVKGTLTFSQAARDIQLLLTISESLLDDSTRYQAELMESRIKYTDSMTRALDEFRAIAEKHRPA